MSACNIHHTDPGVVPETLDDIIEEHNESQSVEDDDPPEGNDDEAPFEKTYLAIDGVEAEDIDDQTIEELERRMTEVMLHNGYAISGARVISDEVNVIELDGGE